MSSIIKILNRAISERKTAVVRCNNQHAIRVIEPHVIYTTGSGEIVIECFQTRGFTESGNPPPLWTKFRIASIRSAYLLNDIFEVRLADGFDPEKMQYRHGLLSMVKIPEPELEIADDEKRQVAMKSKSLLGKLGSTIDNILSNQAGVNKVH